MTTTQPDSSATSGEAQQALKAIEERLALTYNLCCGTAPKQSVGELLAVTLKMPEWETLRRTTTPAPQAATTARTSQPEHETIVREDSKLVCTAYGTTASASEVLEVLRASSTGRYPAIIKRAPAPSREAAPLDARALREVKKQQADPKLATTGATAYERFLYAELTRLQSAVLADAAVLPQPAAPVVGGGMSPLTNDEVYAEVQRQRGDRSMYVSTNAVNDVMAAVRSLAAARSAPVVPEGDAHDAEIERLAREIYDGFPGAKLVPWVEGGNSLKQDEARRMARAELAAAPSRPEPAGGKEGA